MPVRLLDAEQRELSYPIDAKTTLVLRVAPGVEVGEDGGVAVDALADSAHALLVLRAGGGHHRDIDVQHDEGLAADRHAPRIYAQQEFQDGVVQDFGCVRVRAQLVDVLAECLLGRQCTAAADVPAVREVPARSALKAESIEAGKAGAAVEKHADHGESGAGTDGFVSRGYINHLQPCWRVVIVFP